MSNPCHKNRIANLKRIEGQIKGIIRMIERNEYCIDILNQTKAAKNALQNVENKILETHLNECIKETIKNPKIADKKIQELIQTLKRK
jgi:DNA-binding FrmR family transcriptional regulator